MRTTVSLSCLAVVVCLGQPGLVRAAEPASPALAATGQLRLSLQQAVLMSLKGNQGIKVQQLDTPISQTFEDNARAVFDPVFTAGLSDQRFDGVSGPAATRSPSESDTWQGTLGLSSFLPTGTSVALSGTFTQADTEDVARLGSTRVGASVSQALLRGRGAQVNLARLRQAKLDTVSTEYAFRGYAEALVASTENAYWTYVLTIQTTAIYVRSLELAQQQRDETLKRIEVGSLAPAELPAAEAEVAQRRQALITAQGDMELARLNLIQLLNPAGNAPWDTHFTLTDAPDLPPAPLSATGEHVTTAMRMRPEMNQTRLQMRRGDLELVRTRNGLLPKLDLFFSYGPTAYARAFRNTWKEFDEGNYDAMVGLTLTYELGKRDDKATFRRARLQREQSGEAYANLGRLVEQDVRGAMVEMRRALEQIAATAATRKFREESWRAETEKYKNGKSTSLLVGQAQRDLLSSQVDEVQAKAQYCRAVTAFYRLEGTLLQRRGLDAPGTVPIEDPAALP